MGMQSQFLDLDTHIKTFGKNFKDASRISPKDHFYIYIYIYTFKNIKYIPDFYFEDHVTRSR